MKRPRETVDSTSLTACVSDEDLSKLQAQVQQLTSELSQIERRQPFVYEFIGPPKALKTTTRDIVGRFFEKGGLSVFSPVEAASNPTERQLRENLVAYNVSTGTRALQNLLRSCYPPNRFNLLLMDRGIIDVQCWFVALQRLGYARKKARDAVHEFFSLFEWTRFIDGVILMTCDPRTSDQRESQHQLTTANKLATSPSFMETLVEVYRDGCWAQECGVPPEKIVTIDTSNAAVNLGRVAYEVASKIMGNLDKAVDPEYVVIGADRVDFDGFVPYAQLPIDFFGKHEVLRKRKAERNADYKQLVSYAYVESQGKILRLHRTGKSNRSELRGTMSVGVGGHVEICDLFGNGGEKGLIANALLRELREEFVFDGVPQIQFKGWINDESIDAGRYHVAAIHKITVPAGRFRVREEVPDQEFGARSWAFVEPEKLYKDSRRFDPWSRIIIDVLLGGPKYTPSPQGYFQF
ncbi:MAG: hypothetical protein ACYTG0_04260 [Planctomycetota bacterium]|jgi:predicted NUDIX family phosphoesterase